MIISKLSTAFRCLVLSFDTGSPEQLNIPEPQDAWRELQEAGEPPVLAAFGGLAALLLLNVGGSRLSTGFSQLEKT